jgi:hypothetical protein
MNWDNITSEIPKIASAVMLIAVFIEIVFRTIIFTVTEIRRAWKVMTKDNE